MFHIVYRIRDPHTNERIGFVMLESETKIYSKVTLAQALSFAEQKYVYGVKVGIVNGQPQLKSLPGFHL